MSKYIEVKGNCGRVWHVPLEKVRLDIAKFYKQDDGITLPEAKKRAAALDDEDLMTWVSEQYIWREVVRDGVLRKDLTDKQLIALGRKMANQIRGADRTETWGNAKSFALKGGAA